MGCCLQRNATSTVGRLQLFEATFVEKLDHLGISMSP